MNNLFILNKCTRHSNSICLHKTKSDHLKTKSTRTGHVRQGTGSNAKKLLFKTKQYQIMRNLDQDPISAKILEYLNEKKGISVCTE